jgi:drug/metabolite transporter (DMT)-like permease
LALREAADRDRWRALAVLMLGACVIGFSPVLVRLTQTGPAAAAVWRLGFALPFLALMAARAPGGIGSPSGLALIAGVMFALDLGFWHYGVKYTSVGAATLLSNLTPVVVTAFAWAFQGQRPRKLFLVAVVVALGGAGLMAAQRHGAPGLDPPLGNALSASTALWYALYMIAVSAARRREGTSSLMLWSGLVGLPLVLAAAWALGEQIVPAHAAGWAACAALGLVHVGGQGSIAWAMGRLPAATASVVVLVQPVVAALLGWALFHEAVGGLQALGGATALAGVVLAQWASAGPVSAAERPAG